MLQFKDIVGHNQIIEHMEKAVKLGKLSHAYILDGEEGAGKRTLARAFAAALQCEGTEEKPCMVCKSCKQAEHGNQPDIIWVQHEKPNSIGVEDIREQLIGDIMVKPYSSPYKIYVVPEAQKMTPQAQNALLKTIEEPPAYAVILLLTTNASMFLPTILSRCVTLSLKPVSDELVKKYLMENVQVPDYQADVCVAFAQGNIGKAVQLATSDHFNEIKSAALHLLTNIKYMDISEVLAAVKQVSNYKVNIQEYLDFLAVWYRDVLYFKATKDANGLVFQDQIKLISDLTNMSSYEGIEEIISGLQKAKVRLAANVNFDITMEMLFFAIKEN